MRQIIQIHMFATLCFAMDKKKSEYEESEEYKDRMIGAKKFYFKPSKELKEDIKNINNLDDPFASKAFMEYKKMIEEHKNKETKINNEKVVKKDKEMYQEFQKYNKNHPKIDKLQNNYLDDKTPISLQNLNKEAQNDYENEEKAKIQRNNQSRKINHDLNKKTINNNIFDYDNKYKNHEGLKEDLIIMEEYDIIDKNENLKEYSNDSENYDFCEDDYLKN